MKIAVFCGSRSGASTRYLEEARAVGTALAQQGIDIIYGGGSIGLMGALAEAALGAGGKVIGIIPRALQQRERPDPLGAELRVVETMHQRKAEMAELADAFVAMPGGIGTLEEIFEVWTWAQLGQHRKPCGFLNINGYYNRLFAFIDHMVAEDFLPRKDAEMLIVRESIQEMLISFHNHTPPETQPWLLKGDL
jgi:uncharacterized protein (TIGR00730 family)